MILAAQLERLPQAGQIRQANMDHFEKRLRGTPGLAFLERDKRQTRVAAYQFVFKYLPEHFGGIRARRFWARCRWKAFPAMASFTNPFTGVRSFPSIRRNGRRSVGVVRRPSI